MVIRKRHSMWQIVVAVVIIAAFGVFILLNFGTQKNFIPENPESSEMVIFDTLAREMDQFPQTMSIETMEKEGVVSILHGTMDERTSILFDNFVANSSAGKTTQVILVVYTTEGDPIYMNVMYDRIQYFAVIDHSHDRFKGEGEDYENLRYDYLKIITSPETGSKFVVLTNDSELTFEQLRIAQIGSDMESIDSYQLFSWSN